MRDVIRAAPQPWMLRNRDDRPSPDSRSRAHSAQDRFVIRDVFNHIKRASEIEDIQGRNVTCVHLHELYLRRQTLSRVGQSGWMQFGPDQTIPRARLSDGTKHGTIAAADLEKSARPGKVFARKADDQFIAGVEPEVLRLQLEKPIEKY